MPKNTESPVGISEASSILGVSEPALRQWTNEGIVKSFLTPGGHRRYSRADLKRFMSANQNAPGVKDLAIKLEDSVNLHREIAVRFLESIAWYGKLDGESQKQFSELGRSMLSLIIRGISDPAKREVTISAVQDIGRRFGVMTFELGLPLVDALHAFIQHRDPIVSVTTNFMKKSDVLNRRISGAIPLIDHAMDEALVALVAAHQERKNLTGTASEGG